MESAGKTAVLPVVFQPRDSLDGCGRGLGAAERLGPLPPEDVAERMQELADRIVRLRGAYCRSSSLVADAECDTVEKESRWLVEAIPDWIKGPILDAHFALFAG